ncbi:hypothetical protein [Acinetobacter sp. Ac_5812]|uniref:hypothetical protein n=1 Tax=Acinetobacter sp. Ac_5812 TaxID=1848937 RepID=UPI001C09ED95|nr:hypothetical protein [Acinetobacter sp. Ac_5812]NNP69891.1 hypothetical protein [Acinetobacter sp. Ac_5812]
MAKVTKSLGKPYLRENDHPFVSISIFLNYVRRGNKWTDEEIKSVLKEARSKDKHHLYKTLMSNMDKK